MCLAAGSATTRECDLTGEKNHENCFFFLFVLQFILLISIKSGDPAHLGELLGAWQPGVPTQRKPASESVISITSFLPPSYPSTPPLVFFFLLSRLGFLYIFSLLVFLPHLPIFSSCFFLSYPRLSSSSHLSLWLFFLFSLLLCVSLGLSVSHSLMLSLCVSLPSLSQTHMDTHRHCTRRKKQTPIVLSAEGHFLSATALLHCLLLRPDTWKIVNSICTGE